MSETKWDVIVAGTGAAGSAALYQLARRGVRALGLDRWHPPHTGGSSHGDTRITRLALGEGEEYLPFARRSHEVWRELEAASGGDLFRSNGCLVFGPQDGRTRAHGAPDFLATTAAVARRAGLPHEILNAVELQARFPQFRWRGDETGVLEHDGGYVRPEACIAAQLDMARRLGASLRGGEQMLQWDDTGLSVRIRTDKTTYETAQLILTTGAWLPAHLPSLTANVRVFRQVQFWFEPDGPHHLFEAERMPVFIRVPNDGSEMFYGFPALDGPGGGLKIAGEQFEHPVAPDAMDAAVHDDEAASMHALASPRLHITPRCVRSAACKYTVTPDFGFVIDRFPGSDRVSFASACSGHGFKHSAGVGEALAELAVTGKTHYDLSRFQLNRFASSANQ